MFDKGVLPRNINQLKLIKPRKYCAPQKP